MPKPTATRTRPSATIPTVTPTRPESEPKSVASKATDQKATAAPCLTILPIPQRAPTLPEWTPPTNVDRSQFKEVLLPLDVYNYAVASAMIQEVDVDGWIVRGILDGARCTFDAEATILAQRVARLDENDDECDEGDE